MIKINIPESFVKKAYSVNSLGGRLYIVGGAVRDAILQRPVKDYDLVATGITLEQAEDLFGTKVAGNDAPVFLWSAPDFNEAIEVALARTEKKNANGTTYSDFTFYTSPDITIEQDLKRRDFTINAMAYDILQQEIIDPFGGRRDLQQRVIKLVDEQAFKEDTIRALRAARFAARYNFTIDDNTIRVIKQIAPLLKKQTVERITKEIEKALKDNYAQKFINWLQQLDLLQYVFVGYTSKIQSSIANVDKLESFAGGMSGDHKIIAVLAAYFLPYASDLDNIKRLLSTLRFKNIIIDSALYLVSAVSSLQQIKNQSDLHASDIMKLLKLMPRTRAYSVIRMLMPTLVQVFTNLDGVVVQVALDIKDKQLSDYGIDPSAFDDKSEIGKELLRKQTADYAEKTGLQETLKGGPMATMKDILTAAETSSQSLIDQLTIMHKSGELENVLPKLNQLWNGGENFPQPQNHHPEGNAIKHILAAIYAVDDVVKDYFTLSDKDLYILRVTMLFHDLGKANTYNGDKEKPTYYEHADKSVESVDEHSNELGDIYEPVKALVKEHMSFLEEMSIKSIKKRIKSMSDTFRLLLPTQIADTASTMYNIVITDDKVLFEQVRPKDIKNIIKQTDAKINEAKQQLNVEQKQKQVSPADKYIKDNNIMAYITQELGAERSNIGLLKNAAIKFLNDKGTDVPVEELKDYLKNYLEVNNKITEAVVRVISRLK